MALLGSGWERSGRSAVSTGVIVTSVVLALLGAACSGGGAASEERASTTSTPASAPASTPTASPRSMPTVTGPSGRVADEPCEPAIEEVDGRRVLVHCGPATARLTVGGSTYVFEGGSCERSERHLAVNIGRQVLQGDGKGVDQWYLGLLAGDFSDAVTGIDEQVLSSLELTPLTGDGPFDGDVYVTWVLDGAPGGLRHPEITFRGEVSEATFSGEGMLGARGQVSGRLDCGVTASPRSG